MVHSKRPWPISLAVRQHHSVLSYADSPSSSDAASARVNACFGYKRSTFTREEMNTHLQIQASRKRGAMPKQRLNFVDIEEIEAKMADGLASETIEELYRFGELMVTEAQQRTTHRLSIPVRITACRVQSAAFLGASQLLP
jgi:hypothetical protein